LPKLEIAAKYKLDFRLLGADLKSDGDYYVTYEKSKIRLMMQGRLYKKPKDERDYMRFESVAIKFRPGIVTKQKLTNLFGGNKVFTDIVHNFVRDDPDLVLANVYPQLEDDLSNIIMDIGNSVIKNATFDELFPL
jgi:hypothetical protein